MVAAAGAGVHAFAVDLSDASVMRAPRPTDERTSLTWGTLRRLRTRRTKIKQSS